MRAILTYHSIDASGSPISVDAQAFARHVDFFASGRVRVLSLADLIALDAGDTNDPDAIAITFDDGFVNFAEEAWPRLAHHDLPATLFVVTGRAGGDNAWDGRDEPGIPRLPLLDWDELGRLVEAGLELGAHGRTHPHLERVSDARQAEEIEGSAADLEQRTGRRPASFCYPYGSFDERSLACVRRTFQRACTTQLRVLGPEEEACRLPRLDAYYVRAQGRLEAFGTRSFGRYLRARGALRRLKGLVGG